MDKNKTHDGEDDRNNEIDEDAIHENTEQLEFEEISPISRKRQDKLRTARRQKMKKKQFISIFMAGMLTGILLSSLFSLLLTKKEPAPVVPETPPISAPVVNEIIIDKPLPKVLMEGRNHSNEASEYAYDITEVKDWMSSGRGTDEKTVFLTFDDGPGRYTEEVLDILKEKEVPATFFLLGKSAEKIGSTGQVWKRYVEEGHGIGLHSYSHDYGLLYPERTPNMELFKEELATSSDILKERMGEDFNTRLLRFPGGSMSWRGMTEAKAQLAEDDIYDMDWNAMTGDSESADRRPKTSEEAWDFMQDGLKRTTHPETVVLLMHDSKEDTVNFIGDIIDKLKEEGYTFGIMY